MRLVVALGGNAILRRGERGTAEEQFGHVRYAAAHLAGLAKEGHGMALTHGNGPQVGDILLKNECARDTLPRMPLDICGAESQGMLGYMIQQSLENAFREAGVEGRVITVVTQTVVDPGDPAFSRPSKPIGPFYGEAEARQLAEKEGWAVHPVESPRGAERVLFRRVVPSPEPVRIVEEASIRSLVAEGFTVIAAGGGGIPVVEDGAGNLAGIEAVIDKDLTAERLATGIGADLLLILTDVEQAALRFGTPGEERIGTARAAEFRRWLSEGHFPGGSMGPKVRACIRFVENGGPCAVITSLEKAGEALRGTAGTRVLP